MCRKIDVSLNALFSLDEIPGVFLSNLISCATLFKEYQEHAILRNLTLYNIPFEENELETLKKKIACSYMKKYCLRRIPLPKQIVPTKISKWRILDFQLGRVKRSNLLISIFNHNEIFNLQTELKEISCLLENFKILKWVNVEKKDWQRYILYVHGKTYDILRNTKFCHMPTFSVFESLVNTTFELKSKSFFETLLQEKQSLLLDSFLDSSSTIREGGEFELKSPVLSRFAVATVWMISLLFSQVLLIIGFLK